MANVLPTEDDLRGLAEREKRRIVETYPGVWRRMIHEWRGDEGGDAAWLMYSANYLFRADGVRWAMDPTTLGTRVRGSLDLPVAEDLAGLAFVVLTHRHGDHFDPLVIDALAGLGIVWVVPGFLVDFAIERSALSPRTIRPINPGETITVEDVRLTAFEGRHYDSDGRSGVEAMGYLVEAGGRRLLLPGDTRRYDSHDFPDFGRVDVLFAHLWLGRRVSLAPEPPLLEEFCRFCIGFDAAKTVVTHLGEVARDPRDYWSSHHAGLALDYWREHAPDAEVLVPEMGERVPL